MQAAVTAISTAPGQATPAAVAANNETPAAVLIVGAALAAVARARLHVLQTVGVLFLPPEMRSLPFKHSYTCHTQNQVSRTDNMCKFI